MSYQSHTSQADRRQLQAGQPESGQAETRRRPLALCFDRDEWELVVTLPGRVLIAAVAAAPADARQSAQGIAGIEAIASGLASASPLVREVVASIYSESHREPADLLGDQADSVQTLAACRYVSEVVAARCAPWDAQAYRDWLNHIAAVVTGVAQGVTAAPTQPGPDTPSARVGLASSRFLYALGGVLRA